MPVLWNILKIAQKGMQFDRVPAQKTLFFLSNYHFCVCAYCNVEDITLTIILFLLNFRVHGFPENTPPGLIALREGQTPSRNRFLVSSRHQGDFCENMFPRSRGARGRRVPPLWSPSCAECRAGLTHSDQKPPPSYYCNSIFIHHSLHLTMVPCFDAGALEHIKNCTKRDAV